MKVVVIGAASAAVLLGCVGTLSTVLTSTHNPVTGSHAPSSGQIATRTATLPAAASAASPATAGDCTASMPLPARLPAVVAGVTTTCGASQSATEVGAAAPVAHFALKGAANADTAPLGVQPKDWSQADLLAGRIHGSTDILYRVWSGTTMDQPVTGGTTISSVSLGNGYTARLTRMASGLGPVRLEWTDGRRSFLLLTAIGRTADGPSGPALSDLLAMAGSIN